MDLRLDALDRGLLRRARRVSLVGVGASLERWRRALATGTRGVEVHALGRPGPRTLAIAPPVVLVFGAEPARHRWRLALIERHQSEGRDFVFVA